MSTKHLVSIIIPCYNAAQWVSEAVNSCLAQTYSLIEIIVIDDGSTDDSVEKLRVYGDHINLQEEPENRGGDYARNQGIARSKGNYIQFLDADDYLLPEKIAHQVAFLQENDADVVYGDWRHQFHNDGYIRMGEVKTPGHQEDVLTSLLRGWWTSPASVLFNREAVLASGGWDESLTAGQDRDFFISVAMAGADIRYQPGCYTVYRRYGAVTVSTSNELRWRQNHERLLDKARKQLDERGGLTRGHKQALAVSYFHLARNYYCKVDRGKQMQLYETVLALDPQFRPQESRLYRTVYRLFGFRTAEWSAQALRQARGHNE